VVMINSTGAEPNILRDNEIPPEIQGREFGYWYKFAHDTNQIVISASTTQVYYHGNIIRTIISGTIKAAFVSDDGRVVIVLSDGTVESFGTTGDTDSPYDATTNPDGYEAIGVIGHVDYMHVRPDGGRLYGFDTTGYCSVNIAASGLSTSGYFNFTHDDKVTNTTDIRTGNSPIEEEAAYPGIYPANDVQTRDITTTHTMAATIGVYWYGSAGAWIEQEVTLDYSYTYTSVGVGTWLRHHFTNIDGTTVIDITGTERLTIDAGSFYSKDIVKWDFTRTIRETYTHKPGWDWPWIGSANPQELNHVWAGTYEGAEPEFLGQNNYYHESNMLDYVMSYERIGGPSAIGEMTQVINQDGRQHVHNGAVVLKVDKESSTNIFISPGSPGQTNWIDFKELADMSNVLPWVLTQQGNDDIAQAGDDFLISLMPIYQTPDVDFDDIQLRGPYLGSHGFLDETFDLSTDYTERPQGQYATLY